MPRKCAARDAVIAALTDAWKFIDVISGEAAVSESKALWHLSKMIESGKAERRFNGDNGKWMYRRLA